MTIVMCTKGFMSGSRGIFSLMDYNFRIDLFLVRLTLQNFFLFVIFKPPYRYFVSPINTLRSVI